MPREMNFSLFSGTAADHLTRLGMLESFQFLLTHFRQFLDEFWVDCTLDYAMSLQINCPYSLTFLKMKPWSYELLLKSNKSIYVFIWNWPTKPSTETLHIKRSLDYSEATEKHKHSRKTAFETETNEWLSNSMKTLQA